MKRIGIMLIAILASLMLYAQEQPEAETQPETTPTEQPVEEPVVTPPAPPAPAPGDIDVIEIDIERPTVELVLPPRPTITTLDTNSIVFKIFKGSNKLLMDK